MSHSFYYNLKARGGGGGEVTLVKTELRHRQLFLSALADREDPVDLSPDLRLEADQSRPHLLPQPAETQVGPGQV